MTTWEIHDNKFDLSLTHSIAAPREIVYEVLADMEAYPEFINDLVSVQRDGDMYHFLARAAILTIPVTIAVTKTPGQSVAFEMVEGPVDRLSGAWLVEADEASEETQVKLTIHAETSERGEWLLRMTGRYVQKKTDKLVNAFGDRVAEIQQGEVVPVSAPDTVPAGGLIGWLRHLWVRLFGRSAPATSKRPVSPAKPVSTLFRDEDRIQTLEALASTMIPADDADLGAGDLGFVSLAEMRSRYETGREELYAAALNAVDKMAQTMFDKPKFVDLAPKERTALLDAVRGDQVNGGVWGQIKPSNFFDALWEDVVFLYCTHPDTWRRIGYPGPSFETGGYRDFDQRQEFMGETREEA
jgi:ribosome-associated toxin RatA of RatAB toxin-antitoxin module